MNEKALRSWFYRKNNPLEIVSNLTAKKKNGKWLIPKKAVNDFIEFKSNYLSTKEIAKLLHVSQLNIQQRIKKKQFKCIFTIGNQKYVHKKEITPLIKQAFDSSNYYTVSFLVKHLNLDHSTIIDHIHRNAFPGSIKQQSKWYIPKNSVKEFNDERQKLLSINNIDDYYSLAQAARILELKNRRILYRMLNNQNINFPFITYGTKKQIMFLKEHIDSYQKFTISIPERYYTAEEVERLLPLDKKQLQRLTTKWEGCMWIIYQGKYQKIIPKEAINNYLNSTDSYRVLKLEQPVDVFRHTVRSAFSSSSLDATVSIMDEFFLAKIEFSQAHADIKRMLAREYGLFCKELLNLLDKDIMYCSDAVLKMLFNNLSSGNYKVHFTQLLDYCQTTLGNCVFSNDYKVSSKSRSFGNDKEIYSLKEFTLCQKYIKNIDKHLLHALKDRRYASTWLFVSLHFTNAWRAKDFLALPFINIDLAGNFSFNWFKNGNRLNNTQAQKIINQYASQRLVVSKTGALNRFLVNFDMLIPFATMIIICDLHRKQEHDSKLIHLGNKRGTIRKDFFIDYKFKFQSRKMNRSFMTYLFHKAVQSSEYKKIALSIPQRTRAHTKQDSTAIYIQTTNQDEPIDNVTEHLFNRGHFGYLYNLLIQTIQIKKQDNLSLEEETFRLLELKRKFLFPLTLESFGHFLQKQQEKFEPIAIQIFNMPLDSLETKLETLYKDLSPSHTEHIQCFNYPDCITPNCFSCVGCIYSVPKTYLLISIKEELSKRISILQNTNHIAVAEREKSWILKLLSLLQEAVDTFGKEYVNSFINLNTLFQEIQLAFLHFEHYFIRN